MVCIFTAAVVVVCSDLELVRFGSTSSDAHTKYSSRVCECVRQCVRLLHHRRMCDCTECVRECGLSEKDGRAGSLVGERSAVYKMAADGLKRSCARARTQWRWRRRLPGHGRCSPSSSCPNTFTCGGGPSGT